MAAAAIADAGQSGNRELEGAALLVLLAILLQAVRHLAQDRPGTEIDFVGDIVAVDVRVTRVADAVTVEVGLVRIG